MYSIYGIKKLRIQKKGKRNGRIKNKHRPMDKKNGSKKYTHLKCNKVCLNNAI